MITTKLVEYEIDGIIKYVVVHDGATDEEILAAVKSDSEKFIKPITEINIVWRIRV